VNWTETRHIYGLLPHPPLTVTRSADVDYSNTVSGISTKVKDHYAEDERTFVLLGPTTYSTDDGFTWQYNPYATTPALEAVKAKQSNALMARAARRFQGSGCQFPPPIGGRR
jgi:hypothetical protein